MALFSPADTLEILGFKSPDFTHPAYKYTSCEAFLCILKNQTFRFSSPDAFKDTYELTFDRLDPNISIDEYQTILSNYIELTPSEERNIIPSFEETMNNIPIEKFLEVHDKFYRAIKSSAMIFCSTRTQTSECMWKEYADNEAGVCFAFRLEPDIRQFKEFVLVSRRVNYTDEVIKYKQFSNNSDEICLSLYNWIFSKQTKYKFEDEIRTYLYRNVNNIIDIDSKYCFFPFNKENILEVYFGVKSGNFIDEIIDSIKKHAYKPKIYKMVKVGSEYVSIQL